MLPAGPPVTKVASVRLVSREAVAQELSPVLLPGKLEYWLGEREEKLRPGYPMRETVNAKYDF